MSLVLAVSLMVASTATPSCSWDRPGVNPYMGDIVSAVDHYHDISPDMRATLKERMARHDYDDVVTIGRERISGNSNYDYDGTLQDMHFGAGAVCASVTRSKWPAAAKQRALVYCEKNQCIVVPTICRNVSRISRRNANGAGAVGSSGSSLIEYSVSGGAPTVGAFEATLSSADNTTLPAMVPARMGSRSADSAGWTNGSGARPLGGAGGDWGSASNFEAPYFGSPVSVIAPIMIPPLIAALIPVIPNSPVPEPATWMLLLAGLGIIGRIRTGP